MTVVQKTEKTKQMELDQGVLGLKGLGIDVPVMLSFLCSCIQHINS